MREAARRLRSGQRLLLTSSYAQGMAVLGELRVQLAPEEGQGDGAARLALRAGYREAAGRLLVEIRGGRACLPDAPEIGFLSILYPELDRFCLPMLDLRALHTAWQWFSEGAPMAVLGHRIHPFYGTYAPARTTHLELFGTWLSQYRGRRERGIDVGTGCGVLALMLCRAGFERVLATDLNPNAVESLRLEVGSLTPRPPIDLRGGDLLCGAQGPVDLVVFNPPWSHGPVDGLLDAALFFEGGLFERFFDQASSAIRLDGRIVILFSNLIRLTQPGVPHPIEQELARGRLRLVQKMHRRVAPTPDESGRRRRTREEVEVWELALAAGG